MLTTFERLTISIVGAASFVVFLSTANASNLLIDGSFELGGGSLTGWTTTGTQLAFLPSVVVTDGSTPCCFGEAVPADTVLGGSPDAAGTHGVYFVDDRANQSLSQSVFLAAGDYEIGFDAYAPQNGFNNPGDAFFKGIIAGITLADYTVKTQNMPRQWINYSGLANVLVDGVYSVNFNFNTLGGASADVVIDRVYIATTTQGGGTPIGTVPEPASLALIGIGLGGLGGMRHRKSNPS